MDMKFTLKPNGEVVLEWEKNGEKKKVEIDHAIAKVDIENINPTPGGVRVILELSVSEIDVQYDSDRARFKKRLLEKIRNERQ